MAIYQPPDPVVVAIGSAFPGAPLIEAGRRLLGLARAEPEPLGPLGLGAERLELGEESLDGLKRMLSSPRAQKHDTSLQMKEAALLMARARGWMATLRLIAGVNLTGDTPSLHRVASPEPELVEGYPRDLLAELERRLSAAHDLAPRLADAGLSRSFMTKGRRLVQQLKTAVGPRDLRPEDLELELRRFYMRKGGVYLELKRWTRIGKLAFLEQPERAAAWNLEEVEPIIRVPLEKPGG